MPTSPALLSVAVVASLLLALGGGRQLARGTNRTRAVLMLVAAAVLMGNVLIASDAFG